MWRDFRRGVNFYDTQSSCRISVKTTGACENRQEYVTVCPSSQWHWFKRTSASIHPAGVSLSKTPKAFRTALTWMFCFAWLEAPVDNKRLELGSGTRRKLWSLNEQFKGLVSNCDHSHADMQNVYMDRKRVEQTTDFDLFSHSGEKSSFGCETLACTVLTF